MFHRIRLNAKGGSEGFVVASRQEGTQALPHPFPLLCQGLIYFFQVYLVGRRGICSTSDPISPRCTFPCGFDVSYLLLLLPCIHSPPFPKRRFQCNSLHILYFIHLSFQLQHIIVCVFCFVIFFCVCEEVGRGRDYKEVRSFSFTDRKDQKGIFKNVNYLWAIGLLEAFFNALNIFYNKCLIL